jgi:hypothetical protein
MMAPEEGKSPEGILPSMQKGAQNILRTASLEHRRIVSFVYQQEIWRHHYNREHNEAITVKTLPKPRTQFALEESNTIWAREDRVVLTPK